MEQLITRDYWIPKIVTFFGMFAGMCNWLASDWGYGENYTMFHTVITLIYMALAIGTVLYCIHRRVKSSLMTATIHWAAVVLLMLPAALGKMGVLEQSAAGIYAAGLLSPLNAALFGVNRFWGAELDELALCTFPMLFAALMLALIAWGTHRMQR